MDEARINELTARFATKVADSAMSSGAAINNALVLLATEHDKEADQIRAELEVAQRRLEEADWIIRNAPKGEFRWQEVRNYYAARFLAFECDDRTEDGSYRCEACGAGDYCGEHARQHQHVCPKRRLAATEPRAKPTAKSANAALGNAIGTSIAMLPTHAQKPRGTSARITATTIAARTALEAKRPAAPSAPVAEPRGDEAEAMLASLEQPIDKLAHECSRGELSELIIMYRIEDILREAYSAGRARGIEEGARRAAAAITKLCDERDDSADVHCGLRMAENEALAIADAIAKETL